MYEFKYFLTYNDYLAFNKFHLFHADVNKKTLVILRFMIPAILCILMLLPLLETDGINFNAFITQAVLSVVFSVLWFSLFKPLVFFMTKLNIQKAKKYGKLPYNNDVIVRFGEDFLTETTSETESNIKYSHIERIAKDDSAIYIYFSTVQAFILPLSVFESTQQCDDFLAFLNSKASSAK